MKRREYLTAAGVAGAAGTLSGCLEDPGTADDSTPPDSSVPSATLAFAVDETTAASESRPAELALRVDNGGDRDLVATAIHGPVLPFEGRIGTTPAGDRLVCHPRGADDLWLHTDGETLAPTAEALPTAAEANGCWRVPPEFDGIAVPPGALSRDLSAGGSLSGEYELYGLHECVAGTYTVSQAVTLTAGDPDVEEDRIEEPAVPLRLVVAVDADGNVDVEQFGVADGYEPSTE